MAINYEIKSNLAKLLATEDIIVENRKVETACFNVKTRVLTLPMWQKASDDVYTMLVLHEISHALWTPSEDWLSVKNVPKSYANIVEDARIEKLCKKKYPGSPKSFYNGYKELNDKDFFQLKGKDISEMQLADRINLYFKIGNFIDIKFTEKEQEFVDKIQDCETFEDVINVSKELYKYCKDTYKNSDIDFKQIPSSNQYGSGSVSVEDFEDSEELEGASLEENEESEESEDLEEDNVESSQGSGIGDTKETEDIEDSQDSESKESDSLDEDSEDNFSDYLETVDKLEESIKELIDSSSMDINYVHVPDIDIDKIIAKNSDVHDYIDLCFKNSIYGTNTQDYVKFKASAQKEVNYLIKEFESLKSADRYSRSFSSRTGVLDTSKLHTYMYNEDIFKKVNVIPDGKNHGLIFILDWSGSMDTVIKDTCKQLYSLIWFCKKVSIPFEVYAFTTEWGRGDNAHNIMPISSDSKYKKEPGSLHIDSQFFLMNLFTSKVSQSVLDHQMKNIWKIVSHYTEGRVRSYANISNVPTKMQLSGTPLNESILCLHKIIPQFQKSNKLQKVQCVILTDGESSNLKYVNQHNKLQCYTINPDYLRDKKLGTLYELPKTNYVYTDVLLKNLKDNYPDTNFIGFRILGGREVSEFVSRYYPKTNKEYHNIISNWSKTKTFSITTKGYGAYFGISSANISRDSDFSIEDGSSVTKIKTAFSNSFKTKKMNKKILNEFISLIV